IPSNMKPVQPDTPGKVDRQKESPKPDESKPDSTNPQPTPQAQPDQKPQQPDVTKPALETGKSEELGPKTTTQKIERTTRRADDRKKSTTQGTTGEDAVGNEAETQQSYEVLTIKVAQKYFFDRHFGGALIEGRRNQFYPIDTLSGFTFGGRARGFSPMNV